MKASTDKLMLIGLTIFSLAEGLSHFGLVYYDSPGYVAAAHFFQGKNLATQIARFRLLRPVVPFLASQLNYFMDIRTSFAVVNLVFWCATAVLMFYFTRLLTTDTGTSLLSSVLLTAAPSVLLFGDAVLTDMAGYFFILLGMYLVIRWDLPRATLRRACMAGLIVAVGILSRESVLCVLIFSVGWAILSRGSMRRLVVFLAIPLGIAILWSLIVGVSYLAWYNQGGLLAAASHQQPGLLSSGLLLLVSIQSGFGTHFEVIILAALGLLQIKQIDHLKIHSSILAGALAVIVAWPVIDVRLTFILFPSILSLAGAGLQEAYAIIFKSRLVHTVRPSLRDTKKSRFVFLLFAVVVYVLLTNFVARGNLSFPWKPATNPSLRPVDLQ